MAQILIHSYTNPRLKSSAFPESDMVFPHRFSPQVLRVFDAPRNFIENLGRITGVDVQKALEERVGLLEGDRSWLDHEPIVGRLPAMTDKESW